MRQEDAHGEVSRNNLGNGADEVSLEETLAGLIEFFGQDLKVFVLIRLRDLQEIEVGRIGPLNGRAH